VGLIGFLGFSDILYPIILSVIGDFFRIYHKKILYNQVTMKKKPDTLTDPLFGLWSREGVPQLMDLPHRHNELELNLVERGEIEYLFPGRRITVREEEMFFFWSAVPHQLIGKQESTYIHWMTLPLAEVLRWRLPDGLIRPVLEGKPVLSLEPAFGAGDLASFRRWHADLASGEEERTQTLLLEVQARLRRMAEAQHSGAHLPTAMGVSGKVELMARYLAEHFQEEWRVRDVAREAGLNPNYAMQVFQRDFGVSLVEYATQLKIAMAQQLLVTSSMDVLDIAYECGFGSPSRFYAAFKAVAHTTPRTFRQSLRWSA
jgi:AraC family transcriptional regulator, melibiose operon regulatory protein